MLTEQNILQLPTRGKTQNETIQKALFFPAVLVHQKAALQLTSFIQKAQLFPLYAYENSFYL